MRSVSRAKSVRPGRCPSSVPEDIRGFRRHSAGGKVSIWSRRFRRPAISVGMCGDGANDAPALRQAQMGIAVSTATDVAKSAAGIVLTKPGLGGIVASVKEGRLTFQRILTYTLNSVTKKIVQVLFLLRVGDDRACDPDAHADGDYHAHRRPPRHVLDDGQRSPFRQPNAWRIGPLTAAGVFMGLSELVFCAAILAIGKFRLDLESKHYGPGLRRHRIWQSSDDLYESCTRTYWDPPDQAGGLSRPPCCRSHRSGSTLAILGIAMAHAFYTLRCQKLLLIAAACSHSSSDFIKVPFYHRLNIS